MIVEFFVEKNDLLYSQLTPIYFLCGEAAMGLLGFEPRTKGL